ncbi:MAG: hypothetical protein CME59_04360 [Halioglobus sp.]|nr:hypothetical protein [Halioglobus sp.]
MRAIVHIGTEKTGTTSIQKLLYVNRRKFRGAGYHFIQSAGKQNNRALPAYCINDDKFDDFYRHQGILTLEQRQEYKAGFLREFEAELASLPRGVHTVLISSEHFHSRIRTEEEMDNVHALLSPYFEDIRILCYLREQVTTCASYYSTHLKSGGMESFDVFMQRCAPGNYYFNYHTMLANWERCFGRDALEVALFDKQHFLNGDLLDDFTARIDPSLVGKVNKNFQSENESLTPAGQAFALAVNRAFPIRTASVEEGAIRDKCRKLINQRSRGKGQLPSLESQHELFDAFRESNELLREKFFPDEGPLFREPSKPPPAPLELDDTLIEMLMAVLKIVKKEGRGVLDARQYSEACGRIIASLIESTAGSDADTPGRSITLSEADARLLRRAAVKLGHRDLPAAIKLLRMAHEIDPSLSGVGVKLEEFQRRLDEGVEKSRYMIAYFFDGPDLESWEEERRDALVSRLQEWVHTLELAEGSPMQALREPCRFEPGGAQTSPGTTARSYTMILAASLEEAREAAQRCPFLDFGVAVEVYSLNALARQAPAQ